MAQIVHQQIATIANGASLSNAVQVGGGLLARISMPAAWTTANLTFQTSFDNITFQDLYDDQGNEVTAVAVTAHDVLMTAYGGFTFLKVRSGTSGSPVNQGGARAIGVVVTAPFARLA